jgi:hypothetical protein
MHAASPAHPSRTSLATSRRLIRACRRPPLPRSSRGWPWSDRDLVGPAQQLLVRGSSSRTVSHRWSANTCRFSSARFWLIIHNVDRKIGRLQRHDHRQQAERVGLDPDDDPRAEPDRTEVSNLIDLANWGIWSATRFSELFRRSRACCSSAGLTGMGAGLMLTPSPPSSLTCASYPAAGRRRVAGTRSGGNQSASRFACLPTSRTVKAAKISFTPKTMAHTPTRVIRVSSDRSQERTAHTPRTSSATPSSSPVHQ